MLPFKNSYSRYRLDNFTIFTPGKTYKIYDHELNNYISSEFIERKGYVYIFKDFITKDFSFELSYEENKKYAILLNVLKSTSVDVDIKENKLCKYYKDIFLMDEVSLSDMEHLFLEAQVSLKPPKEGVKYLPVTTYRKTLTSGLFTQENMDVIYFYIDERSKYLMNVDNYFTGENKLDILYKLVDKNYDKFVSKLRNTGLNNLIGMKYPGKEYTLDRSDPVIGELCKKQGYSGFILTNQSNGKDYRGEVCCLNKRTICMSCISYQN